MRNSFRIPLGHVSITLYSKGKQRTEVGEGGREGGVGVTDASFEDEDKDAPGPLLALATVLRVNDVSSN